MKLKEKHTSKFLILIAGLIIFAHAVIPHHHHFDSIELHPENINCETTSTDRHNENSDTHCNAFNLIISKNENNLIIHSSQVSNSNLNFINNRIDFELVSKNSEVNYTHRFIFPPYKQIFLSSISLRAPPATI